MIKNIITRTELSDFVSDLLRHDVRTENILYEMSAPSYLHWNALARWVFWKRRSIIEAIISMEPYHNILDFGCGMGLLFPVYKAAGAERIFATDLFPSIAEAMARRQGIDVMIGKNVGFIETIPDGSLDLVVAADSIEHVDDCAVVLNLFLQKMKPGGMLVISDPSENALYRLGRRLAGRQFKGDYHHRTVFDIQHSAIETGFTPVQYFSIPPVKIFQLFSVTTYHV